MRLPFRRDNSENAVLMRDLETLADFYRDGAPPPPPRQPVATPDGPPEDLIEDGYVRAFLRSAIHVRRYLPFYGIGAALLLVFALVAPVDDGFDRPEFAQGVVSSDATEPGNAGDAGAFSTESVTETEVTVPSFSGGAVDFGSASAGNESSDFDYSFSPEPSGDFDFDDPGDSTPTVQPLRITASGYASVSGGTPFEVEPPDGALPVSAGAGEAGRISFIKVAGDEQKLRLQEKTGSVGAQTASIRACLITEEWEPERGMAMSDAPAYDDSHCSTGVRTSDGIWTFELLTFAGSTGFGLALVPGPGTAPPTFDVSFEPQVAPPASTSAEG